MSFDFVFISSSTGDTELAQATALSILQKEPAAQILFLPLAVAAQKKLETFSHSNITTTQLSIILGNDEPLAKKRLDDKELAQIATFLDKNSIRHAYIGVSSPNDEEIPYQLATSLSMPVTVAHEFMFTPVSEHSLWRYMEQLTPRDNVYFAIPLEYAKKDFPAIRPGHIRTVGHLSIDRSLAPLNPNTAAIKEKLLIDESSELAFISGTTQAIDIDTTFLEALLQEITSGNHPTIQIRWGIHPGVRNLDDYLKNLLTICEKYPAAQSQIKIILTPALEQRLQDMNLLEHPWVLRTEVSGADAANAANRIAQAVPGALLNEAAIRGRPSYFHHQTVTPYPPKTWFTENIATFFQSPTQPKHTREELGLTDETADMIANLLL